MLKTTILGEKYDVEVLIGLPLNPFPWLRPRKESIFEMALARVSGPGEG
jgi:hypothetical protein